MLTGEIHDLAGPAADREPEYRGTTAELRRLVHRFADDVVLQLTGEAGVAQTRIAYVQKGARRPSSGSSTSTAMARGR